jgi:hypothetical protein
VRAAAFLLAPALVAQPAPGVTARLRTPPVLHADFQQTRRLAALSRPLKASGSFVVARDQGVVWRLDRPLPLTVVLAPRGVLEVDREGRRRVQTAKDMPMAARMAGIMNALLGGQWSALDELFTVKGEAGAAGAWTLLLAPRPATAAFLKAVRIKGGAFVESIHVEEASGDTTDLVFQNFRPEAPLTPEEQSLLAFE